MTQLITRLLTVFALATSINCLALDAPRSLEEWKPWVLENHPELNCPILFNNTTRMCAWPSELHVETNNSGAKFSQRIEMFKDDWVTLPGSAGFWPQNINDNNAKIAVRDKNNLPEVYLSQGVHDINGEIRWSEMPRTLTIPENTGLVQLSLNGKNLTSPAIENGNQLWLTASEKQNSATHQDSFNLHVFRKIEDAIPLRITTLLKIDISGKERELSVGQFLLNGFTPLEFTSALPARIEKNGELRIQVKPGSWELRLISQSTTPVNDLSFKSTSEFWPQQEIWVFSAERQLRSVQISGVQTIDPQQTQLPEDWKKLPAYLVTPESHFKTEELQRGESKDLANSLKLNRSQWLSFDGKKFIFKDKITGNTHASRLETHHPVELTSAQIGSEPQLITQLINNKNPGFEIRNRELNLSAISQLPRTLQIPVAGWNDEFTSVSTELHLPPGWSLITATGTSSEYGSWISHWRLWDVFSVLIIIIAIARVTTPINGLLAAATIILIYQRTGAPIFIWLNLIAAIALAKLVTGKFQHFIQRYTYISFLFLGLIVLPFAVREARIFVNPQLEKEYFWDWTSVSTSRPHNPAMYDAPIEAASPAPLNVEETVVTGARSEGNINNPDDNENETDEIPTDDSEKFTVARAAKSFKNSPAVKIQRNYDPSQQTQTGIAVPEFQINTTTLRWDGPVKADETTRLFLVSPWINRIGHLLAMLLPIVLAGILLRYATNTFGVKVNIPTFYNSKITGVLPILIASCLLFFHVQPVMADVNVDTALLKELEQRLTRAPLCLPECASIESVNLNVKQDQLVVDLVVHSSDLISFPLPADHAHWWPTQVTVDDKSATLLQSRDQGLLVSLPKGRHNIRLTASVQNQDAINLNFPVQLHNVLSTTVGWEISGVPTHDQSSQSLQLQRVEHDTNTAQAEHLRADPIAAFVIVERELSLDLEWTLTSRVIRVAPEYGAINIEMPTIDGESPLSTQLNSNGKIVAHLETNQNSFEWRSTLKQTTPLQLKASQNVPWVEIWTLRASPMWHTETKGIAPIQLDKHEYVPVWRPWPGETLSIDVVKPKAVKGNYVTIDSAKLHYQPGNKSSFSTLDFSIRSNQGGQYSFKLPKDAHLVKVSIDGEEQMISSSEGVLKLPLHPGSQIINIQWKSEDGLSLLTKSPAFSLEQGSSNQNITIEMPNNRWPLFVGGPLVGPSILLWGLLIVMSIVGYALGRSRLTPLKSYEWILLSLGICTLNFVTFILVAVWLIALHKRGQLTSISTAVRFKFLQATLFILSILALGQLVVTLPNGLLSAPDMHILGNQSYQGLFRWYQDHSDLNFPQAWVLSLPLWCYKAIMLLWSLWLAASLMRWIRWAWQQLSVHGLWYASDNIIIKPKPSAAVKEVVDNKIV